MTYDNLNAVPEQSPTADPATPNMTPEMSDALPGDIQGASGSGPEETLGGEDRTPPEGTPDPLPAEASSLPEEAQNIFRAAFRAASSDGMSDEGASEVAWNSVRNTFVEGENGEWHFKAEDIKLNSNTGTMPHS